MDRHDRISKIATRVAFFAWVEGQPEKSIFPAAFRISSEDQNSIFKESFVVVRQKAKDLKEKLEQEARDSLQKSLISDLSSRGYEVVSVDVVLGKYRGSRFVTSANVKVIAKDGKDARALEKYLKRYHPRYNLKVFDSTTKIAEYNIR